MVMITEFTNRDNIELDFDVVDDAVVFMRNDPAFYRKHYFPAVMALADAHRSKQEINNQSVLGGMIDKGINSYCQRFNLARKPADIFSMDDRQSLLQKIASEEMELIKKGEYDK